ncbi:MAG: thiamine pyrophosphate-binding protein [Acidimicrobiia bacterium]|nr:thiamine pyrophosphate-binding protein [Acidimicrobiia bacterium]
MTTPEYVSDVIVARLARLGIQHIALNPGASFRGIHDSLVNFPGAPEMIEVPHEKIAVGMAHGYAKATGKTMGVMVHDLVGLLHASLGVYYAYVDRAPMLIVGGAGPMDQARRRPWIDWIHTANSQNETLRSFTKWDDHPFSAEAIPDSLDRAFTIARSMPQGPTYVSIDSELQELALDVGMSDPPMPSEPSRIAPDPAAIADLVDRLAAAERPMLVAGYVGRDPDMWEPLQRLAELSGSGVVDTNLRLSFPTRHRLNATGTGLIGSADLVVLLDVKDVGAQTGLLGKNDPGLPPRLAPGAQLVDVGFGDLEISSWASHHGQFYRPDLSVLADTSLAIPQIIAGLERRKEADVVRSDWCERIEATAAAMRAEWQQAGRKSSPTITYARLVAAVGEAIVDQDWVLSAGTANGWASRLWDFEKPDRHPGRSLGTAAQIGISLGVALAHRDDPDKLVVALQPDGDLMFDASALWVASHHRLPMLMVMVNNRAYGNDVTHQQTMAKLRNRPMDRAGVGVSLTDPDPDYATLARSFGWIAHGPIENPDDLTAALTAAVRSVVVDRRPVLVDVVCEAEL